MTASNAALAAVCGTYCPTCRFYGVKCGGCGAVKGKPFWVKEYNRDVCRMYGCCVDGKKLEHCGECAELPCETFNASSDPSHTPEQSRISCENRIAQLKLRAEAGTQEWLKIQMEKEGDEMGSTIKDTFEQLVIYKAKRMQNRPDYLQYRQHLLREFKVNTLEEAFLIGAFDAMAYEMASTIGQAYMKPRFRENLIKKIKQNS